MKILSEREAIEYLKSKGAPKLYHSGGSYYTKYKKLYIALSLNEYGLSRLYTHIVCPPLTKKNIDLVLKMVDDARLIKWEKIEDDGI